MPNTWQKLYDESSGQYYYLNSIDGSSTWDKPSDYAEPNASWAKEWDSNSKAYYYLNSVTGESTWEKPPDFIEDNENSVSSGKSTGASNGAQSIVLSVWDKIYDPSSGNYYYYNNVSGVSQWEVPRDFNDKIAKQSYQTLRKGTKKAGALLKFPYYAARQHATGKIQGVYRQHQARKRVREKRASKQHKGRETIDGTNWTLVNDAQSGYDYWFNVKTFASSWEIPFEIASSHFDRIDLTYVKLIEGTVYFSQVDPTTKNTYYANKDTQEVAWEKPEAVSRAEEKILADKHETHSSVRKKWSKLYDNQTGSYYYYNLLSGETQWEMPGSYAKENQMNESEWKQGFKGHDLTNLPHHMKVLFAAIRIQCMYRRLKGQAKVWKTRSLLQLTKVENQDEQNNSLENEGAEPATDDNLNQTNDKNAWTLHSDPSSKNPVYNQYWFNSKNHQMSFDVPFVVAQKNFHSLEDLHEKRQNLIFGSWGVQTDPDLKKVYYFNIETKFLGWEKPEEIVKHEREKMQAIARSKLVYNQRKVSLALGILAKFYTDNSVSKAEEALLEAKQRMKELEEKVDGLKSTKEIAKKSMPEMINKFELYKNKLKEKRSKKSDRTQAIVRQHRKKVEEDIIIVKEKSLLLRKRRAQSKRDRLKEVLLAKQKFKDSLKLRKSTPNSPEAILDIKRKYVREEISKKRDKQKRQSIVHQSEQFAKYSELFKQAVDKEMDNHNIRRELRESKRRKNIKKKALRSKQFNRVSDIRKQDIRNLWEACRYGATYKRLQQLTMGRNIMKINERNFLFDTPLHIACRHGQYEVVKFLLNKRAQVNVVSDSMQKITPLHEAMYNGHFDCAELLLQNGANPAARDHRGWTPDQVCPRLITLDWWNAALKDQKANFVPPPPPPKTPNVKSNHTTSETDRVHDRSPKQIEKVERQKRYEAAQLAKMKGESNYTGVGW